MVPAPKRPSLPLALPLRLLLPRLLHPLRSPPWTVLPQPLLPLLPRLAPRLRRLVLVLVRLARLARLARLVLLVLLVCPEGPRLWAEQEEETLEVDWALLELEVEPGCNDWNVREGMK